VRLPEQLAEQGVVRGGERRDVGVMRLGDDDHVDGSLRVDIAERQHSVGFNDQGGGDFPGDDGANKQSVTAKIVGPRRGRWIDRPAHAFI